VELPPVTWSLLFRKAVSAAKHQLTLGRSAVFFWPVNAFLAGSVLLIRYGRDDARVTRLLTATIVLVGLFSAMVWLHANQARLSLIIVPAILLSCAVSVNRFSRQIRQRPLLRSAGITLVGLLLVGFLAIDVALVCHLRSEAELAERTIGQIRKHTEHLDPQARVVIESRSSFEPLLLAHALHPRKCLILAKGYLSHEVLNELSRRFRPSLIFCHQGSDLPRMLDAEQVRTEWSGQYRGFVPYEVQATAPQPRESR
jgi:hypothetical protein